MICFRLRDYHPLWSSFPACSTNKPFCNSSLKFKALKLENRLNLITPTRHIEISKHQEGLGFSLFTRRYLGNQGLRLKIRAESEEFLATEP